MDLFATSSQVFQPELETAISYMMQFLSPYKCTIPYFSLTCTIKMVLMHRSVGFIASTFVLVYTMYNCLFMWFLVTQFGCSLHCDWIIIKICYCIDFILLFWSTLKMYTSTSKPIARIQRIEWGVFWTMCSKVQKAQHVLLVHVSGRLSCLPTALGQIHRNRLQINKRKFLFGKLFSSDVVSQAEHSVSALSKHKWVVRVIPF